MTTRKIDVPADIASIAQLLEISDISDPSLVDEIKSAYRETGSFTKAQSNRIKRIEDDQMRRVALAGGR